MVVTLAHEIGLGVDFTATTVATAFTRLGDAVGKTAGADFDIFPMYGNRKRCVVADDGTIRAYYGEPQYKEDGSAGQVMVYQPRFYYKVVPVEMEPNTNSGIGYHLRKAEYWVSDEPLEGYKLHPAFYDINNDPTYYILFSAYEGSMWDASTDTYVNDSIDTSTTIPDGSKLCSIGNNTKPISGKYKFFTKANAELLANNRGLGWHLETVKATSANQLLMIIEFGTLNTQTALGNGVTGITDNSVYNCSSLTGSTSSLGNASGAAAETINEIGGTETPYYTNRKVSVSYRGMENPWGNIFKHIQGINIWGNGHIAGGQLYVADGLSGFNESKHSDNYKAVGFTIPNASGYINAFGYGNPDFDWLLMPSEIGGTSSLPVGDYAYVTANLNGYRIPYLGGGWHYGANAGGFGWNCASGVGTRGRTLGGRLLYVPTQDKHRIPQGYVATTPLSPEQQAKDDLGYTNPNLHRRTLSDNINSIKFVNIGNHSYKITDITPSDADLENNEIP